MRIPVAEPDIGEEEFNNVAEAMMSGWISSKGNFIEEFEKGFAMYCGMKHGVATSNGTAALHLALATLGTGTHDEVIVPDLTFVASANSVIYTGAKPVLADVNPDYWCLDPDRVRKVISKKTKVIMPVHLYGHPCDMDPLMELAEKHGLFVIEDAAEAHGAEYKGRKVGSFGDISCFSFYGNKIITTGEGGMCLTNDENLADKMRVLRDHGMRPEKRYWHDMIGFNYRMTNLQAALGVAQLKKADTFVEKKRLIAKSYARELSSTEEIVLHPEMPWAKCVYWLYSVLIGTLERNTSRDELMSHLEKNGIESRPFFYPIHQMPPYTKPHQARFPISNLLSKQGLNLPSSVKLSEENIANIAETIIKFVKGT